MSAAGAAGEIVDGTSTVKLCPLRVHIEIGGCTTIEIDSLRESVEIVLRATRAISPTAQAVDWFLSLSSAGAAGEIVDVPSTVKLCPLRVHIEIGGYTTIEIDSLRESVEIVLPWYATACLRARIAVKSAQNGLYAAFFA